MGIVFRRNENFTVPSEKWYSIPRPVLPNYFFPNIFNLLSDIGTSMTNQDENIK
jgi:hypothetical protein